MAWLALLPGRLLERIGNNTPRGMVAHDRTRLNDRLPHFLPFLFHGFPPGAGQCVRWRESSGPYSARTLFGHIAPDAFRIAILLCLARTLGREYHEIPVVDRIRVHRAVAHAPVFRTRR